MPTVVTTLLLEQLKMREWSTRR